MAEGNIVASNVEKDGLISLLFRKNSVKLLNVKFFRGDEEVISEDEFQREVH